MDMQELGFFIYMEQCEKESKRQQQAEKEALEKSKEKQIAATWRQCPPKTIY